MCNSEVFPESCSDKPSARPSLMARIIGLGVLSCSLFLTITTASKAADLIEYTEPKFGCILKLSGPIVAGDAQKIYEKLYQFGVEGRHDVLIVDKKYNYLKSDIFVSRSHRICLDSIGGSFSEAIRIADIIYGQLGTAVEAGFKCLSACAVSFMAGTYNTETDAGIVISRVLEAGGKLGFHAPALAVPDGQYTKDHVQRAYKVSVAATGALSRRMAKMSFSPSLLTAMYSTPPDEMLMIEYIHQAALWEITIAGIKWPRKLTARHVGYACFNAYRAAGFTSDPSPLQYFGNAKGVSFSKGGWRPVAKQTGYGQEGAGTCVFEYNPTPPESWDFTSNAYGSILVDAWPYLEPVPVGPWMLHPGSAKITDVAASGSAQKQQAAQCAVFSGSVQKDREPCTFSTSINHKGYLMWLFDWPSGSRTVITFENGAKKLNGNDTAPDGRHTSSFDECLLNRGSGNTFCFKK